MRKLLAILGTVTITGSSVPTVTANVSYQEGNKDLKNNLSSNQIDLRQQYQPNSFWFNARQYKGTWINKDINRRTTNEVNLTNAFLSTAINKDLPLYQWEVFTSFQNVMQYLTVEMQSDWINIINNYCASDKNEIEYLITTFYNVIVNIFGISAVNEIVTSIKIIDMPWRRGTGAAYFDGQRIEFDYNGVINCFDQNTMFQYWQTGFISGPSRFTFLFHELGHLVDFYFRKKNESTWNSRDYIPTKIFYFEHFLRSKINNIDYYQELNAKVAGREKVYW